jgi:ribosomal protein S6--L-glutamate ligase
VAGTEGGWSSEQMVKALRNHGVDSKLFSLNQVHLDLQSGAVTLGSTDLSELDGLAVRKLGDSSDLKSWFRINFLDWLSHMGMRIFSKPESIRNAVDRFKMTLELSRKNIPAPQTVITESVDTALDVIHEWGKAVLKPLLTSKGRGMVLLDKKNASEILPKWKDAYTSPFYLQQFVPSRWDTGVAVLGSEIIGGYKRVARAGSWKTTTSSGGKYEKFSPDLRAIELAKEVSSIFKLDFTVVDLVPFEGDYLVYEVSAFGGFTGLWETSGIDVANLYAEYIIKELKNQ